MNERRAGIGSPRSIPCPRIDYVFSGFHGPTGAGAAGPYSPGCCGAADPRAVAMRPTMLAGSVATSASMSR